MARVGACARELDGIAGRAGVHFWRRKKLAPQHGSSLPLNSFGPPPPPEAPGIRAAASSRLRWLAALSRAAKTTKSHWAAGDKCRLRLIDDATAARP